MIKNKKVVVKWIVGFSLIAILFTFVVNASDVISIMAKVDKKYYIFAVLANTVGTIISVYRWEYILNCISEKINFRKLIQLYYIGLFYNILLPGSISGDVIRGYKTTNEKGDSATQALSVAMERVSGLVALFIVMIICAIFLTDHIQFEVLVQIIAIVLIIMVLLVMLSYKKLMEIIFETIPVLGDINFIRENLYKMSDSLSMYRNKNYFLKTTGISLFFILISRIATYFVVLSAGAHISYFYLLGVISIISIVAMIPISVGGLGVREGLYVYYFGLVGINAETAVAIGFIGYSIRLIDSLVGGVIDFARF